MVATLICDRWSPEQNPNASMRGIYSYFVLRQADLYATLSVSALGVSKPHRSSEITIATVST